MTWDCGSVSVCALEQVEDVPANISGNALKFAQNSLTFLSNHQKATLDPDSIDDKYSNVLINMTALKLLGQMEGIGADLFNYTIGDVNVQRGGQSSGVKQMQFLMQEVKTELMLLGRPVSILKSKS